MSETTFRKYYAQTEFTAMGGNYTDAAQFETHLSTLALGSPVVDAYPVGTHSIAVEWAELPLPGDIVMVDAAVAAFVALPATDAPLSVESLAITTATTSALVTVIDATTPPRQAGAYRFDWCCLVGMLAAVTNTGVRGVCTVTRTQGADVVTRTWEHNWTRQEPQTFSGGRTFNVAQGATIRVLLQVAKVGAAAATAQMAVASVTVDKIG